MACLDTHASEALYVSGWKATFVSCAEATLGLEVPDLDAFINWNKARKLEPKMNRHNSLPEAISNLAQNHKQILAWNFHLMDEVLKNIIDIVECKNRPSHKWPSFYLKAKNPALCAL